MMSAGRRLRCWTTYRNCTHRDSPGGTAADYLEMQEDGELRRNRDSSHYSSTRTAIVLVSEFGRLWP